MVKVIYHQHQGPQVVRVQLEHQVLVGIVICHQLQEHLDQAVLQDQLVLLVRQV
jgi:hypothetical protein